MEPISQPHALSKSWVLPYLATLGSSVRKKGVFLEVRARLPPDAKKALTMGGGRLVVAMPKEEGKTFDAIVAEVSAVLEGIESLPVLPREVEDILSITTTERRRWTKDGRLKSAGTRTVKLRGRTNKITFHVFDPRLIEETLDRDLVAEWREQDAIAAAEKRRQATWKAKLRRLRKRDDQPRSANDERDRPNLKDWDEFARQGLLR